MGASPDRRGEFLGKLWPFLGMADQVAELSQYWTPVVFSPVSPPKTADFNEGGLILLDGEMKILVQDQHKQVTEHVLLRDAQQPHLCLFGAGVMFNMPVSTKVERVQILSQYVLAFICPKTAMAGWLSQIFPGAGVRDRGAEVRGRGSRGFEILGAEGFEIERGVDCQKEVLLGSMERSIGSTKGSTQIEGRWEAAEAKAKVVHDFTSEENLRSVLDSDILKSPQLAKLSCLAAQKSFIMPAVCVHAA
ncbi:hypothetical protein CYMTET_35059, partial [Cymbomonas tetramitiformis]